MEKRYILYVIIAIVCIICIGLGVKAQFYYVNVDRDPMMMHIEQLEEEGKIEENEENTKNEFNNIFSNTIRYETDTINNKATRSDMSKDLVYTLNQYSKTEPGKYEININLPTININTSDAYTMNEDIEDVFLTKATTIISSSNSSNNTNTIGGNIGTSSMNSTVNNLSNNNMYTIYNVDYVAFVNNDILSIVIRATLKEGSSPQRVMFMTYNYNLDKGRRATLTDILNGKNIKETTMQNKINKEIKEISKQKEALKEFGYSVYTRNIEDKMYKLENTNLYLIGPESTGYIIYAYGNSNNTSEYDVILF